MDAQLLASVISAAGTITGACIVGIAGSLISKKYSADRDRQDKESQWRDHAVELTRLDIQRKIEMVKAKKENDKKIRPGILDFLANYRDLKELDHVSPGELYRTILEDRISK